VAKGCSDHLFECVLLLEFVLKLECVGGVIMWRECAQITYVCMYACMHVCMYIRMYVCFIRKYVCMYACMYVCVYIMYVRTYV
jgi:hypothetical protein